MTASAPLRVAVAGAGFIATRGHIPVIQRHPDTELAALVEVNPQRAAAVAEQYAIPAIYSDYTTMLREIQPDLVIICTPNAFHAPMSIAAMEAGAHVLCEKPMALSVADAQAMVETSHRTNRVFTIGLHNRFRPEMAHLKQLIGEGQLGDIYYSKVSLLRRRGIPGFGSWFTNRDLAGGGALMDIGVHMVDLALWLMNHPTPVSVTGVTYSAFGPRGRGLGGWGIDAPPAGNIPANARFDVDDLASGLVRFADGAALVVDVTWAGYTPNEERIQLLGTEGGADIYNAERQAPTQTPLKLYHDLGGRSTESLPIMPPASQAENPQWLQLSLVVDAIRTGSSVLVTPEQALMVTAVLCALQESAGTGRTVDVNLLAV